MKYLHMVCRDCGTTKTIEAVDVNDAIKQLDGSGWRDMPDPRGVRGQVYRCPSCERKLDPTDPRD